MSEVNAVTPRTLAQAGALGIVVVFSMVAGGLITAQIVDDDDPSSTPLPQATEPIVSTTPEATSASVSQTEFAVLPDLPALVEQTIDSVVRIESVGPQGGQSVGTGIVLDTDGHILTNYHVIEGVSDIRVQLHDGSTGTAEVLGADPGSDLAVLRASIQPQRLVPATFGDSDAVRVGEPVFAIGNPFSQEFSTSAGVISAVDRTTNSSFTGRTIRNVLQTDAALNPGNSGGPLFNAVGEVIGVNTSIENPDGRSFAGLGFAVPSNTAMRFLPQMLAGDSVEHSQLGVTGVDVDTLLAEQLELSVEQGVYITTVVPGSAAHDAGLVAGGVSIGGEPGPGGDIVVAVDGEPVNSIEQLAAEIDRRNVGDTVELTVRRGGDELTLTASLAPWN
ncbi:MAG: PDZ domain-containing protein [Dehalococcoidia bacterium]|nr:PDZ domain-containing protein [Dehalococcoidia bacterium]